MRHLCQIASKDRKTPQAFNENGQELLAKDTKISKSIKLVHSVLRPFMNAQTTANKSASRAGKWTEMQFNPRGKLIGMKVLDYLLEKPRVTLSTADESNFDIFYMFLAGSKQADKQEFELLNPHGFNYLGKANVNLTPLHNIKFHDLLDDMKSIGIGKRQQHEIFKLMAAILHLGNIDFVNERDVHNDPASILHYDQLECAAMLLGVEPANLEVT